MKTNNSSRNRRPVPSLRSSSCSLANGEVVDHDDVPGKPLTGPLKVDGLSTNELQLGPEDGDTTKPLPSWSFSSLMTLDPLNTPLQRAFDQTTTNRRNVYGFNVAWRSTDEGGLHRNPSDLEAYRMIGDPPVDDMLERLESVHGFVLHPHQDIFQVLEDRSVADSIKLEIQSFVDDYSQLPEWVCLDQLKRGQCLYHQFAASMSISLYYLALIPGFSIPKIAQVIMSTGYLAPPSTPSMVTTRLLDTGAFLVSCMLSPQSLLPTTGAGWKTALRVRLLHAKVRRRLLKRKRKPWNTAEYGVPINQEDTAGTLLAFSWICVVGVEFISGIGLSESQVMDYLALWRYIGWLLGIQTVSDDTSAYGGKRSDKMPPLDPCRPLYDQSESREINGTIWPRYGHSKAMLESILFHLIDPSDISRVIARHLLNIGQPEKRRKNGVLVQQARKTVDESTVSRFHFFHRARTLRRTMGASLCDELDIPYHDGGWLWQGVAWCTSLLFLWFIRVYTWYCMLRPTWAYEFQLGVAQQFHQAWNKVHDEDETASAETKADDRKSRNATTCPFAMTAVPASDSD